MGRQWNQIIESLGPLTGGTVSINANLGDIDALLTTIQADIADGITVNQLSTNPDAGNLPVVKAGVYAYDYNAAEQVGVSVLNPGSSNPALNVGGTISANLQDGSGNSLTSSSRGSERALSVQVVDGSGNQITTFGGAITSGTISTGTIAQLTNGTVSASITGGTFTTGTIAQLTSGTVTAQPFRGTTTIGTLTASTTNGTLFATNSTRNYLLVQCTSGTAYLDTNGTATAANGILLTSGQGITFEGSFIPTGTIAAITSAGTAQLIGRQG